MQNPSFEEADIIIIGAGPAGATCALQLRQAPHLKVILLDKATFPRDKVCGDAIGGHSMKMLLKVCPEWVDDFRKLAPKTRTKQTQIFVNQRKPFLIRWVNEAYCCKRFDFDGFLCNGVKQYAQNVTVVENFNVSEIERVHDGILIKNKAESIVFKAKMVIGADGAHSIVAKYLTETRLDLHHHLAAVRTYFDGVADMKADTTEIYLSKKFTPGYFWVFPVSPTRVNIGFGMLSESISQQQVNLRKALFEFIEQSPTLKTKFNSATQVGKVEGFGLPMGSRRVTMSGERFLLTGDAASLIDPASGDGIGNAIASGIFAGEKAIQAFAQNDFSKEFLSQYDDKVWAFLGKELRENTRRMRLYTRFPWLADAGAWLMGNDFINKMIKKFAI